jgi:hypothetical protein
MKVTDASKKEAGSEAQAYYREVAKKVKDFQKPDDGQTIAGPRVPTNTGDDNERLENTGYDIGVSGMEVVADLAAEKGGSEETKKIYKDRVAKLQGDKSNYTPMSKNAKETNDLKYKKDARNTRPVKSQTSKQVEEGLENSSDIVTEADFKISSDVEKLMSTIETKVKKMYPKLFQRVDQPVEKAQIIALFAKIFGISPQELSRVKTVMDKAEKYGESTQSTEESDNNTDSMTENTFKVKGKIISEQQVLKLTKKLPAKIKIDETVFSVTDGETTYKLIWEGDSKTGEAVITNKNNKTQVNEDIQKMKHLWNFDSKESLSTKKNIKEDGEDAFRRIFKKLKENK